MLLRGRDAVRAHARDLIAQRVAPGAPRKGRELTPEQHDYVVDLICLWIDRELAGD